MYINDDQKYCISLYVFLGLVLIIIFLPEISADVGPAVIPAGI